MAPVTRTDAAAHIHADLAGIRRRRLIALSLYLGLFALLVIGLLALPAMPAAMPRTSSWALALVALSLSLAIAASASIGLPLWRERTIRVMSAVAGLGMAGGLALVTDWSAAMTTGSKCLAFGTFISAIAMIVLGALSGRVWRRFPDPGWLLAAAAGGVGVVALHFSCGVVDALHLYAFHLAPLLVLYAFARALLGTRETLLRERDL